jgi:hypothetical protein
MKPALFRIKIQFRDHMLYAQVLAMCTLCQGWASNPALFRFKIHFCDHMMCALVLVVCTLCLTKAYVPALLSFNITLCDLTLCAHGLANGSWSLAWALMHASGCMELMFWYQNFFELQLTFPHPQEGISTKTP